MSRATPLQQAIIDAFAQLDNEHDWRADRVIGDLTAESVMALFHKVLQEGGVPVDMLQVEICNFPMAEGSCAHHNQPGCIYRNRHFLWVDGAPLRFTDYTGHGAALEVTTEQECEQHVRLRAIQDHRASHPWHVQVCRVPGPFYILPGYAEHIQAALAPGIAQWQAAQMDESTPLAASPAVSRPRM